MGNLGEEIKSIEHARSREREKLDKFLATLSVGTFVLSITFITAVIDIGLINIWILFLSWGLLFISIFSILTSLIIVDWHFKGEMDAAFSHKMYSGKWGRCANSLTMLSAISLTLGIIFLGVFAGMNIVGFEANNKQEKKINPVNSSSNLTCINKTGE